MIKVALEKKKLEKLTSLLSEEDMLRLNSSEYQFCIISKATDVDPANNLVFKELINVKEKKIVAHHEIGHALVTHFTEGADPVHKISIIAISFPFLSSTSSSSSTTTTTSSSPCSSASSTYSRGVHCAAESRHAL